MAKTTSKNKKTPFDTIRERFTDRDIEMIRAIKHDYDHRLLDYEGEGLDDASWGYETGFLLSMNNANLLLRAALAALRSMEGSEPVGPYTIQRHPDGDRWQVIGPHGFTSQWKSYELAKILRDEQNAAHPPAPAVVELSHVIKAGDATFDAWLEEVKGDGWPEPSLGFIVHKDKWINVTKPFRP